MSKNLSVKEWVEKKRKEQGGEGVKLDFWRKNYDYGEGFYNHINNDVSYVEDKKVEEKKANVKLAVVRGYGVDPCPFGLPIPLACNTVGSAINRMAPLSNNQDKEKLTKANNLVYIYQREGKKCPFASKILDNFDKVDCDYGDTAQGFGDPSWQGSPLYIQTFNGLDASGLNSQPLGFYAQNDISRNLFFGLFSLLGGYTSDELIKLAKEYETKEELEKGQILENLINKIEELKETHGPDFDKLEKYLEEYRDEANWKREDTGMLNSLFERWWQNRKNFNL